MLWSSPQCSLSAQVWDDATAAVQSRNAANKTDELHPDRVVSEPLQSKGLKVYNRICMAQLHLHQTEEQFGYRFIVSRVAVHTITSVQAITGDLGSWRVILGKTQLKPKFI